MNSRLVCALRPDALGVDAVTVVGPATVDEMVTVAVPVASVVAVVELRVPRVVAKVMA